MAAIRGHGKIVGDFTEAEAAKMIAALRKGMPAVEVEAVPAEAEAK